MVFISGLADGTNAKGIQEIFARSERVMDVHLPLRDGKPRVGFCVCKVLLAGWTTKCPYAMQGASSEWQEGVTCGGKKVFNFQAWV